ncbi:hypothetical protein BC567DRAFT_237792 [Phyllosticta citribraziliensis]
MLSAGLTEGRGVAGALYVWRACGVENVSSAEDLADTPGAAAVEEPAARYSSRAR